MTKSASRLLSGDLLREWHPTKNNGIDPLSLAAKSGLSAWWQCRSCHHEWQVPVYHRSNGTGCPKCAPFTRSGKMMKSILATRGSLAEKHPSLVDEWHPAKNGSVMPDAVSRCSGKKFWWKCPKGRDHEWESTVSNRVKGKGCPVCSGRKAVLSNCLATIHPNVAEEWHPTRNQGLRPTDVTFASHKKIWWQCKNGHDWLVSVANRTSRGMSECPVCLKAEIGRRRVDSLVKKNGSLAEIFPEIAKQWHPGKNGLRTSSEFTVGSTHKAWWRCDKGHEWCASIGSRRTRGCPKCTYQTSQLEIRIYCELKSIFPDAVWRERIAGNECDILLQSHKLALEIDGFPWHDGRESQDSLKTDRLLTHNITTLRVRDNRLLQVDPSDIFYKNRELHLGVVHRTLNNILSSAPVSVEEKTKIEGYLRANKFSDEEGFKKMLAEAWTVPEDQSIASLYPNAVADWDYEKNTYLNPKSFSSGSEVTVYWKCRLNPDHKWKAKIKDRVRDKGCPYCRGIRACPDNSLATLHLALAAQWCYEKNGDLTPSQVTSGSSRKVFWTCSCGHCWRASIWNRTHRGDPKHPECPECYNKNRRGKSLIKKSVQKNGSFSDRCPDLAKEWHPEKNGALQPSMLSCGSDLKVWWKCPMGKDHEWQNSIVARIRSPKCPYCYGKKVSLENSLQTKFPELAKEWHPNKNTIMPAEVTKCSGKKVWWQCAAGHEWEASVISRAKGSKCPYCRGKKASSNDNLSLLYPQLVEEWNESKNTPHSPSDFRPKSNAKVWWRCSRNREHEWLASITSRTAGTGCPFCAGKRTSSSYSLAVVHPELVKEWNFEKNAPHTAEDVTPHAGKKVWWKCSGGHEWQATVNNRSRGRGCPFCRRNKPQDKPPH